VSEGLTAYHSIHLNVTMTDPFNLPLGSYFLHLTTIVTPIVY
jgi:hypothetical protein